MPATRSALLDRRQFLRVGALASGALALGPSFWHRALAEAAEAGPGPYGPLGPVDAATGIQVPQGFEVRRVARGLTQVSGTAYAFPIFPDGQATYAVGDGGFILVTNSESAPPQSGASAIRFDADGEVVAAYRILGNPGEPTALNCGGGPTPWGTWLSGEEYDEQGASPGSGVSFDQFQDFLPSLPSTRGAIWECDPTGESPAQRRDQMGLFKHEAAAVDPVGGRVYLTEDNGNGGFYRFTPDDYPDLSEGTLEIARVGGGGSVEWIEVDPTSADPKDQIGAGNYTEFDRGEGIWYDSRIVYVATTGDGRIHAYDCRNNRISVVYDEADVGDDAPLTDVDNITVSPSGDLFAAEDNGLGGGNGGIDVAILTPDRTVSTFMRASGRKHDGSDGHPAGPSELTGPVFDPSGTRLFVTSQRARDDAGQPVGEVYMVTGPFRLERGAQPAGRDDDDNDSGGDSSSDGDAPAPAAVVQPGNMIGSGQSLAPGAQLVGSSLGVEVPRRVAWATARRKGVPIAMTLTEATRVEVRLRARLRPLPERGRRRASRRRSYGLASATRQVAGPGPQLVRVTLDRDAAKLLRGRRNPLRLVVEVTLIGADGSRDTLVRTLVLGAPQR